MKSKLWFILNTFCSVVYLLWRIFFTIPFGFGAVSVAAGIILLVLEALGMVESYIHFINMRNVTKYKKPDVPLDKYPHVDVYISTYSEDPELLYKTINGCKRMEYPDKNKVHIYLCDDNRRPCMEELAKRMGVNYLKRANNIGAKAGNLNHAMTCSSSPYILTMDADMIPQRRLLMELMPYFVDAEMKNEGKSEKDKLKIGFIQSPQNFYNPDLFQFNLFSEERIPNEQDYFYKDIQVARTKTNSVIYGGSNTVISREALNAVGGFYTEGITEDFATGILIQKAGYVTLGTGDPLASGMSPNDLPNLVQQRIRWARGVIATGRNLHIYTSKDLSIGQKLNYWASIYYWYAPLKRLIYVMTPIMYATFGLTIFKCTLPQVLAFWLPMHITQTISLKMLSGNIRSAKWTGIYETIMFPFILLPIMMETFGVTLKKFKVTEKSAASGKQHYEIYMIPFLIMIVLSVIGIIRCVMVIFDSSSFGPVVVLFWMITNLYYMIMSVLFVDGRIAYRQSERFPLITDCEVSIDGIVRKGHTVNVSEEGLAVSFDTPYFIEEEKPVDISVKWDIYKADICAKALYVKQDGNRWVYSMLITDIKDSYDEWLQIVHDRIPPLPSEIKKESGSFEDLKLNTFNRLEAPVFQKRMYPRVVLNLDVKCHYDNKDHFTKIVDFNYLNASVYIDDAPSEMELYLTNDLILKLKLIGHLHGKVSLYEITNYEEIIRDELSYEKLLTVLVVQNSTAKEESEKMEIEHRRELRERERAGFIVFDETSLLTENMECS